MQLIIANRVAQVQPDRFVGVSRMWSLRTQTVVLDATSWIVFVDHDTGKPANLLRLGGEYAELQRALVKREEKGQALAEQWEKEHPKSKRTKSTKL
jgi:hypothetical protein